MENRPIDANEEQKGNLTPEQQIAPKKKKKKQSAGMVILRIFITLLIIAVGICGIIFIVAKASGQESIGAMLRHMQNELSLMWQRIIK